MQAKTARAKLHQFSDLRAARSFERTGKRGGSGTMWSDPPRTSKRRQPQSSLLLSSSSSSTQSSSARSRSRGRGRTRGRSRGRGRGRGGFRRRGRGGRRGPSPSHPGDMLAMMMAGNMRGPSTTGRKPTMSEAMAYDPAKDLSLRRVTQQIRAGPSVLNRRAEARRRRQQSEKGLHSQLVDPLAGNGSFSQRSRQRPQGGIGGGRKLTTEVLDPAVLVGRKRPPPGSGVVYGDGKSSRSRSRRGRGRGMAAAPASSHGSSTSRGDSFTVGPDKLAGVVFNAEQQRVLELARRGRNIFFTGSAGTGKSLLIEKLRRDMSSIHGPDTVHVTATTGIAAIQIDGQTLHRWSGIGIERTYKGMQKRVSGNRYKSKMWQDCEVLIIDEISMLDSDLFDNLEKLARGMRGRRRAETFGGIQLIVAGDFFQLPPVQKSRGGVPGGSEFCFDSESWNECIQEYVMLKQVYRQKDEKFVGILNRVRFGVITEEDEAVLRRCTREAQMRSQRAIGGFFGGGFSRGFSGNGSQSSPYNIDATVEATKLYSTNARVHEINMERLRRLSGQLRKFEAFDTVAEEPEFSRGSWRRARAGQQDFRFKLLDHTQGLRELSLKIGAQVMLVQNTSDSLVNGSRGKIVRFQRSIGIGNAMIRAVAGKTSKWQQQQEEYIRCFMKKNPSHSMIPVVKFANGEEQPIEPAVFTYRNRREGVLCRVQIPLKCAWAITIHKSQGLSIDKVEISMERMFCKGHFYVALSRVRSLDGLTLTNFDARQVNAEPRVIAFMKKRFPDLEVPREVDIADYVPARKRRKLDHSPTSEDLHSIFDEVFPSANIDENRKRQPTKKSLPIQDGSDLFVTTSQGQTRLRGSTEQLDFSRKDGRGTSACPIVVDEESDDEENIPSPSRRRRRRRKKKEKEDSSSGGKINHYFGRPSSSQHQSQPSFQPQSQQTPWMPQQQQQQTTSGYFPAPPQPSSDYDASDGAQWRQRVPPPPSYFQSSAPEPSFDAPAPPPAAAAAAAPIHAVRVPVPVPVPNVSWSSVEGRPEAQSAPEDWRYRDDRSFSDIRDVRSAGAPPDVIVIDDDDD